MPTKPTRPSAEAAADPPTFPELKLPERLGLKVELIETKAIQPDPMAPWVHPAKQIAKLMASIREFGFIAPLIVDTALKIIAGHARWEAAKRLGLKTVPAIRLDHLTDAQAKALALADNKIARLAKEDAKKLGDMFCAILELEVDFNIETTGYDMPEIDLAIDFSQSPAPKKEEQIPEAEGPAVTQLGDLWQLGEHLLLCGDALDPAAYQALMGPEFARMIFTDPPYNCRIDGFAGGKGKAERREFAMASGEMTDEAFQAFLTKFIGLATMRCMDGALAFYCIDWRGYPLLHTAAMNHCDRQMNLCVWAKPNAGMGSLYRSQHELIPVYKIGTLPHVNNINLGATGRFRSNVWQFSGMSSFGAGRDEALAMHPTVKNLDMVAEALRDASNRGEIVLDPFAGSGTTLIAAQKTGRRGRGMEIDPLYCDVIVRRWEAQTGGAAALIATGQFFAEVAAIRLNGGVQ